MTISGLGVKTIHSIGWGCYLALLTLFFSTWSRFDLALVNAIQTTVVHAFLFYFNSLILIPFLLEKKKVLLYFAFIVVTIIVFVGVQHLLSANFKFYGGSILEGDGGQRINSGVDGGQIDKLKKGAFLPRGIMRFLPSVVAVLLFSTSSRLFMQKVANEKKEVEQKHQQMISEVKFLKSQVNPHFLFNTLNNIYTLVYLKKDQAPVMLLKLSDMLRYMLYECEEEWVPLTKELTYIDNYIELQKLKTEEPQNIITDFQEVGKDVMIPPLLLIPFIENSFKHSRIEDLSTGWVAIHLRRDGDYIEFSITNSIPVSKLSKDATGGIGLENVKRRLELIYSSDYQLSIGETQNEFSVLLKIKIPSYEN